MTLGPIASIRWGGAILIVLYFRSGLRFVYGLLYSQLVSLGEDDRGVGIGEFSCVFTGEGY